MVTNELHSQVPIVCEVICYKTGPRYTMNPNEKSFHCIQCDVSFTDSQSLDQHCETHCVVENRSCDQCGTSFESTSSLGTRTVTSNSLICAECNTASTINTDVDPVQQSSATGPQMAHSGKEPRKCSECGKEFPYHAKLLRHMKTHNREKSYKCSLCDGEFAQNATFLKHQWTHHGVKPYWCTICNKSFSSSSTLAVHKKWHSGAKPFECTQCDKTFRNSSALECIR